MKTQQFEHQKNEYVDHRSDVSRALLWQMRTGKSKAVIDSTCFLAEGLELDGAIIIAPNGVHFNWIHRELPRHHWDSLPRVGHAWKFSDPENEAKFEIFLKQSTNNFPWLAVNMESLIRKEVRAGIVRFMRRVKHVMTVFDESHHFARPGAKRTAMARGLARRSTYRRILTGTSVENSPLQAFSQYELLKKGALGYDTFTPFKQRYAVYVEAKTKGGQRYPKLDHFQNIEELKQRMAPFTSVVLRSDCHDLPPLQKDVRYVELNAKQVEMWRQVKEVEVESLNRMGFVKPLYGGAAFVKLQQIEGGFLKTPSGTVLDLGGPDNPKMQALLDEIQQYDGQVIVWFQYIHEIEAAALAVTNAGFTWRQFHGGIPVTKRDQVKLDFEKRRFKVLLGQPKAGGEGYDFSAAGKIVWYSQTPDAIVRQQGGERATAVGGESVQHVDLVAPGGVDDHYIELTDGKTNLADNVSRGGMREILMSLAI